MSAAGKGVRTALSLKGLETYTGEDSFTFPASKVSLVPMNIFNQFVVGINPKAENDISYTRLHSANDSIILISYYPKNSYQYTDNVVYKSGRIIIDAQSWTILRIDLYLDKRAIEHLKSSVENSSKAQELLHELNTVIFFSTVGIPSKIEQKFVYSLKNNPGETLTFTTTHIYNPSTESEYKQKPSTSYNTSKFLHQQKPITIADFEQAFSLAR